MLRNVTAGNINELQPLWQFLNNFRENNKTSPIFGEERARLRCFEGSELDQASAEYHYRMTYCSHVAIAQIELVQLRAQQTPMSGQRFPWNCL